MRSYDDPCGIARALDAVGERWALLVVRELLLGPKRFTDLTAGLTGVSQNVLSQRLRELEGAGIVRRRRLGPPSGARGYELTERGAELEPVVMALARWGSREPLTSGAELGTDAFVLALRTAFDPGPAADLRATYQLDLGDDRFHAEIADGRFHIARGDADRPDATLASDGGALRGVVFGGRPLDEVRVQGDRRAAERFVRSFPRPTGPPRSPAGRPPAPAAGRTPARG
ncbi:helix-turn-helix domain-containing protein [Pseudonocardia sp.]|uniref:winged helix-turn-helix transcriptional regulator n=1 Tax=Pseudonocardia sp. TaxID=60912 RepID=UPI00261C55D4|nr:helix-turn-helix domain-containing protein [Pseudonocardia sp.]MCW2718953.1 transcriptional regulator, HxlR family [Pseudonocardia sp.]MDT7615768.1 hypothetical protein [Pseudonocardiales bacterium]